MMQEFAQQVEDTAKAVMGEMHTAIPGTIVSYDCNNGTAVVKPSGKYTTFEGERLEYPQIPEVPVVFPFSQASNTGVIFPVRSGDGCLIVVSEVELDEWRSGAESSGALKFDLTNAVCIPGLMKTGNSLAAQAVNQNAVIIYSGSVSMTISEAGIAIGGDLKVSGNISSTGDIKAGKIALQKHTHRSSEPGTSTGTPE